MANALFLIVLETLKAMFFKIAFRSVIERFINRLVLWGGDKLVLMTTNELDDKTWADIREQLTGKRLRVSDDRLKKKENEIIEEWENWR